MSERVALQGVAPPRLTGKDSPHSLIVFVGPRHGPSPRPQSHSEPLPCTSLHLHTYDLLLCPHTPRPPTPPTHPDLRPRCCSTHTIHVLLLHSHILHPSCSTNACHVSIVYPILLTPYHGQPHPTTSFHTHTLSNLSCRASLPSSAVPLPSFGHPPSLYHPLLLSLPQSRLPHVSHLSICPSIPLRPSLLLSLSSLLPGTNSYQ